MGSRTKRLIFKEGRQTIACLFYFKCPILFLLAKYTLSKAFVIINGVYTVTKERSSEAVQT